MQTSADHTLCRPQGLYSEIAHHRLSEQTIVRGYLFSSRNRLRLTERGNAAARVSRFGLDRMIMANVRSTGHEVAVSELVHTTVIVPLSGRLVCSARSEEVGADTGGILVFPPSRRQTRVIPDGTGPFHAINILIPRNEIRDALQQLDLTLREANRLNDVEGWLDGKSFPEVSAFRALVAILNGEIGRGSAAIRLDSTHKAWRRLIVDKLAEVLAAMADQKIRPDPAASPRNAHVERAMAYIRDNHTTIAAVAEIAEACETSTRTLELAFRQTIGITPYQAITEMRLDTARRLLADPDCTQNVTEVAMACGISHLGRFSQIYRLRFGELPSATKN